VAEPLGYLVKPVQERELRGSIEMALYKIKVEDRLQAQSERLRRVVATVPEGVALFDSRFQLLLANDRATAYLARLSGTAAIGETVLRLGQRSVHDFISAQEVEDWHEIEVPGSPKEIFEVSFSPVQSKSESLGLGNDASEWVLMIRDVTVEREVAARIRQQDRLATVGHFAAGIAHDFNNILSSIILAPDVIRKIEPRLDPRVEERLDTIVEQGQRASALIRQLLDFSRSSVLTACPFSLEPLIKELSKMLERMLPETVALDVRIAAGDHIINGDPTRIMQLLMNLALNARDAMPQGGNLGIEVARISGEKSGLELDPNQPDCIVIRVRDSGTGIDPSVLPHIFEPFFTTKEVDKGTGLGLAQVFGIVEQHKGQISVDSELGQGSTFTVILPALNCNDTQDDGSVKNGDTSGIGQQQTILVVEDNSPLRKSYSEALELSNYQVVTAAHGIEALKRFETPNAHIDLVVTDLVMPEMGGIDFCKELRRLRVDVPVIVITGYMSDDARKDLGSLGISEFLYKPVSAAELLDAIARHCKA
jgi:signal transduction histidine kinase/ActR/RegA family two-component response regulator